MEVKGETVKNAVLTKDFLVTDKELEASDIVLQLPAVVCGPGRGKQPLCLGCLHLGDLMPCSSCTWPVCSAECEKSEFHLEECALLKSSGVKSNLSTSKEATSDLDFITPLRLLTKLSSNKNLKEKIDKEQVEYVDVKNGSAENIVNIINTLKCGYDTKEIEKAIAILHKFSMSLDTGALCVYEDLPNISHSCSPNTYHMIQTTKNIVFRAAGSIKNGSVITYCKTEMTKCNLFRRRLLQKLGVACACERCKDGTEYGTGFGSLQCKDCDGLISSSNPTDEAAQWICGGCLKSRSGKECVALLDEWNNKLIILSKHADDNKESILNFDKLLSREGEWKQLPVNSQLFLDMRYTLIYIYGYNKYFYRHGENNAKVKLDHCDEWIKLSEKLFPGRSYPRILIDFEKINAAVSVMYEMKQAFLPTAEVNSFISEIIKMGIEPLNFTKEEEDESFCKAFKQILMVAVEAREEQKQRVLINQWADEDDEW